MNDTTRWQQLAGSEPGQGYAQRLAEQAASGQEMHGEADRVQATVVPPARVLDAGCGTGRVAIELARRGYDVVGVDLDSSMLEVARDAADDVAWVQADLSDLDVADPGSGFDAIVCAGNVIPLLAAGTESDAITGLARRLAPGGALICGFGLDLDHLPIDEVTVTLAEYDRWTAAAGLSLETRFATWEGARFASDSAYHVSIHRRRPPTA